MSVVSAETARAGLIFRLCRPADDRLRGSIAARPFVEAVNTLNDRGFRHLSFHFGRDRAILVDQTGRKVWR